MAVIDVTVMSAIFHGLSFNLALLRVLHSLIKAMNSDTGIEYMRPLNFPEFG
jgi:hypothetical protein